MTQEQQDKILRRVRGLIAKANSTEFPEEAKTFFAAADELMEKYAIDQAMLLLATDKNARIVVRKDMDISWWSQLREGVHVDARNNIAWLWDACVNFCRCYSTFAVWNYQTRTTAVYGMESDLSYLDMLFTDLLLQMVEHIKPKYDPALSMGHNVMRAKEAGMKYIDIAMWLGHPEWRKPNGTGGYKTADNGKMLREYKAHLRTIGKTPHDVVKVHPDEWQISYVEGFCSMIKKRLRDLTAMRQGGTGEKDSVALVIRDIRDQARDALWVDFPELKPHEADCKCSQCTAKRKPIKYKEGRRMNYTAYGSGSEKGANARIVSNDPSLRTPKKLDQ